MLPTVLASRCRRVASDKLAETGDRSDDLADRVLPGFFTCIADSFTSDALDLAHAESNSHHAGPGSHDAAAEHAARTGIRRRRRDRSLGAGHLVDQGLYLVRRPFLDEELQDDADGLLRGRPVDANVGDETP